MWEERVACGLAFTQTLRGIVLVLFYQSAGPYEGRRWKVQVCDS